MTRGAPPSTKEKYALFEKYVTAQKFIVPFRDGIDIGLGKTKKDTGKHFLIDLANRWIAIPINTANYCQVLEPVGHAFEEEWAKLTATIPANQRQVLDAELARLRLNDAARISTEQFEALEDQLQSIEQLIVDANGNPSDFVKIALLHHHLLPVSTIEEVKKFESFTNLGLVRSFLAKHGFSLVLHGHKHIAARYWDFIPRFENGKVTDAHRMLVVSGGTLGQMAREDEEVCRLIRIKSPVCAPQIAVAAVTSALPGHGIDSLHFDVFDLWDRVANLGHHHKYIKGQTTSEVYARVLAYFNQPGYSTERANLVCHIADAESALRVPQEYPEISGIDGSEKEKWFESLVDWWQLDRPTLSDTLQFTHGERIDGRTKQLQNVIQALTAKPSSSRAVVTLTRPGTEDVHDRKRKFPSFCLIQFIVRKHPGHASKLDCVGFFRKQEMRYWWPVNVCELARLQKRVYDGLPKKGETENLELGSITTVATIAKVGKTPPQVSVPVIDRSLDQDPDLLWAMTYGLFWRDMPNRNSYLKEWKRMIIEFVPSGGFDPDGVPIPLQGLREVLDKIKRFESHHPSKRCTQLISAMERLYAENTEMVDALLNKTEAEARQHFEPWKKRAHGLSNDILKLVTAMFK